MKPTKAQMFHRDFDQTYKASPNNIDRNKIYQCIREGLEPEETSMKLRIKLKSVKTYYEYYDENMREEEEIEAKTAEIKEKAITDARNAETEALEKVEAEAKATAEKKGS